jgi:hypothetical protein
MTLENYTLSGGNATLLKEQLRPEKILLYVEYSGIVATDIKLQLFIAPLESSVFSHVPAADITLDPAKGAAHVAVCTVPGAWHEWRVVAPAATAGTITKVHFTGW